MDEKIRANFNAVTMINDNLGSIQKTFYKAWLMECVK